MAGRYRVLRELPSHAADKDLPPLALGEKHHEFIQSFACNFHVPGSFILRNSAGSIFSDRVISGRTAVHFHNGRSSFEEKNHDATICPHSRPGCVKRR